MTADIRLLDPATDSEAAMRVFRTAVMDAPPSPEDIDLDGSYYRVGTFHGAFVDARLVGVAGVLPFEMTVPGGARVPMGGVTAVGVLPTHTRRGLLTALMRAQVDHLVAGGISIATLRASEAVIYGRFGYGSANTVVDFEVERARGAFSRPLADGGEVVLLEREEAVETIPALHQAVARAHPGAVDRPEWFQERWRRQVVSGDGGYDRYWVAVHRGADGQADGYVNYGAGEPDPQRPGARLQTYSFFASNPTAYARLWRHLLDVDLGHVVVSERRPIDDAIQWLLADRRAAKVTGGGDEIWLRLVDVEAGLAARAYSGYESIVIAVDDPFLPANDGCYRVSADGVARTDEGPDLRLDATTLGSTYLGGPSFTSLAAGGRITELVPGALARADRLFHSPVAPWCGTHF